MDTKAIIRTSIHTFLKHFNLFTNTSLLALPFSASILLSSSLSPNSNSIPLHTSIHSGLRSVFGAAGFPPFFSILSLKLSQTITSSILALPFTFSFLLIAKMAIIQSLKTHKLTPISFARIFSSVVKTQLCNSLLILLINATCFWVLFISFNCLQTLNFFSFSASVYLFSAVAGIVYSVAVANALIVSNLAVVIAGTEAGGGGFVSILKSFIMIEGRSSTALSLALPVNVAFAGVEALFRFRVMNGMSDSIAYVMIEGLFIGYLYSVLITIETITWCVFFERCKRSCERVGDEETGRRIGDCFKVKEDEVMKVLLHM